MFFALAPGCVFVCVYQSREGQHCWHSPSFPHFCLFWYELATETTTESLQDLIWFICCSPGSPPTKSNTTNESSRPNKMMKKLRSLVRIIWLIRVISWSVLMVLIVVFDKICFCLWNNKGNYRNRIQALLDMDTIVWLESLNLWTRSCTRSSWISIVNLNVSLVNNPHSRWVLLLCVPDCLFWKDPLHDQTLFRMLTLFFVLDFVLS